MIDASGTALVLPSGLSLSIARDGTGGLVYLRQVGGVAHVFLSSLIGGSFAAPVQLDGALAAPASSPVIAAGNGGLLVVGFISGGQLFVVSRASSRSGLSAPQALASGASSPAVSMSNFGKAYLAFVVADGSGSDVRAAYYDAGRWGVEAAPLNATPADDAGSGAGRPAVAAAGDGVGIVAWGERGAVLTRRVWATSPSVVYEQADGPLPGCTDAGADDPVVGTEGDSSYADVAFQETLSCSGAQQSRVLMNRLQGSAYDGLTQPDGLSPGSSGGAQDPQITMGEYGHGFVTSERTDDNNLYATLLGDNGSSGPTVQVNSLPLAAPPDGVAATAGLFSDLIAWQQAPGSAGAPEIRLRYAPGGSSLGPEIVVSSPAEGATDAADGLAAAGDVQGDSAVAWLQGADGAAQIMAVQLYQPPGPFAALHSFLYQRTSQPVLAWSAAQEAWGPLTYSVSLDGVAAGQTTATALRLTGPVSDGRHVYQVTAANPVSQQSQTRPATVFVDTLAPVASLSARRRIPLGKRLWLRVAYADLPPTGAPAADASGVASVLIRWGDGTTTSLTPGRHLASHVYKHARRYAITVVVTDKAGNRTRALGAIRVSKPRRHRKPQAGKPGKPGSGGGKL